MPNPLLIWAIAAALYLLFRLWYDNWRGPMKPAEIERFLAEMKSRGAEQHNDLAIIRAFLEKDDGREFIMLNLVKLARDPINPDTGDPEDGRKLMSRYASPFMRGLFARGGHPAIVARPVGGYVDAWNAAPDPGWTIVGFMRYRSRRDMAQMVLDPRFSDIHKYKIAATAETFSFPTQTLLRAFAGPRLTVALLLALVAALAHIVALSGA